VESISRGKMPRHIENLKDGRYPWRGVVIIVVGHWIQWDRKEDKDRESFNNPKLKRDS
jgi:hypothetical protein